MPQEHQTKTAASEGGSAADTVVESVEVAVKKGKTTESAVAIEEHIPEKSADVEKTTEIDKPAEDK